MHTSSVPRHVRYRSQNRLYWYPSGCCSRYSCQIRLKVMSRRLSSSWTAAQSASGRSLGGTTLGAGGYSRHSNSSRLKLSQVSSRPTFRARSTYSATVALPTPLARLACRWLKPHTLNNRNTSCTFRILSLLAGICLPSEPECHGVGALLADRSDSKPATLSDDPQKVAAF